jgi:hypothetical protein
MVRPTLLVGLVRLVEDHLTVRLEAALMRLVLLLAAPALSEAAVRLVDQVMPSGVAILPARLAAVVVLVRLELVDPVLLALDQVRSVHRRPPPVAVRLGGGGGSTAFGSHGFGQQSGQQPHQANIIGVWWKQWRDWIWPAWIWYQWWNR